MARPKNTKEKIERNIDKSGGEDSCWPWLGHTDKDGYPLVTLDYVIHGVHRLMLAWKTLDMGEGKFALHSCDNPICCNPNHLRWGTAKENADDRDSRNRGMRGKTKHNSQHRLSQSIKVSKRFVLTSPGGICHNGINLKEFCASNNLYYNAMIGVCKGQIAEYKGWTGYYEEGKFECQIVMNN